MAALGFRRKRYLLNRVNRFKITLSIDTDIDECFEGTSGCEQLCTNTNGSYTCSCDEGFALGLDLHSCLGKL